MKRIFLKKDVFFKLILISFIFLLILPVIYFLIWILLCGVVIFFHRKNFASHKNSLSNAVDIVLSPVTGTIKDITTNDEFNIIKMSVPFWGPFGLFLPFSAEVSESRKIEGKKNWLGKVISKDRVEFQNKLGHKTLIDITPNMNERKPDVWVKAGDKARSSACFGYVPYGGTITVKVARNAEVLVVKNEKVRAGFTILAGMKG